MSAPGVADYLRDVLIGEGDLEPPVACAHDVIQILYGSEARFLERLIHDSAGRHITLRSVGHDCI